MGMILEYDQSPNATVDQKVSTLKDSVQRALEDVEQNAEGRPGAPGVGIEEIIEQWLLSTSKISPIGTWVYVEERPEWKPNHYFWTRNEVHYTDGNIRYTTPGLADALNRAYEAAYEAGDILGDIETIVSTIEQTVEEITQLADESKELAQQAQSAAEDASEQVGQVSAEIAEANRQIGILVGELETLESTMEASYATKGELTEISTSLGTQIQQNAAQISSTASAVQQVDIDASQALQDAADAAAAAAQAQQNATDAQNKYTQLKQQADVTDEQLAVAQEAVEEAQAAADAAQEAADAAAAAADSLDDRVTVAETQITQHAEQIALRATKTEMQAADDATLASAKSYADAQIEISADGIKSTVSETYATKAENEVTASAVDALDDTVNGKYEVQLDDEGNPVLDSQGNPVQIYTEGIKDSMADIEKLTSDMDETVTRLDTDFGALEQRFSSVEQTANNININFGELGNDMKSWFDFSEEGVLEIGKSESPVVSRQTNESYAFVEKSTNKELLRLDTEGATVDTLNSDQLRVGRENPQWATRLGANGNLDDVWIGG